MKKLLVILLVTSLAVGCKGKKASGWSSSEKDVFTTNCVKGASGTMGEDKAKSYCSCMMGKLEVKYPKADDIDKVDVGTMTEMAKDCVK